MRTCHQRSLTRFMQNNRADLCLPNAVNGNLFLFAKNLTLIRKIGFIGATSLLFLSSCQTDHSSVLVTEICNSKNDTPTPKLKLIFTEYSRPAPTMAAYTVNIFPSNQIPVLDSVPNSTYSVNYSNVFVLEKEHLKWLIEGAVPSTDYNSGVDSIYPFSLFIQGIIWGAPSNHIRAALCQIQYDSRKKCFLNIAAEPIDSLNIAISELVSYKGMIEVPMQGEQLHFFFVPGSPFYAVLDTMGRFNIKLPPGKYFGKLLSFSSILVRYAPIFDLRDSLNTDSSQSFKLFPAGDSVQSPYYIKDLFNKFGKNY
ncbi:MAG: hypothetical protein JWO30_602 [Fibrobacteres bacterium]|nr:hypothetical protein [Fibrobacterota bacterium]